VTDTEGEQPDIGEQPGVPLGPSLSVGGPPLARSSLDRAAHHRTDDAWLADAWKRGRVLLIDMQKGATALVRDRADGGAELVLVDDTEAPEGTHYFLGLDPDGTPLFMIDTPLPSATGAHPANLRDIGHLLDARDAGVFTAAAALGNWHLSHLYSPRSGKPTTAIEGGWSRVDEDGRQMWPRTDPAMIVLVHDGVAGPEGRCLLGHNAAWGQANDVRRFSCLAGYVEPGESAEACVIREVAEEVGVTVQSLYYEGSQSWPFPGSLMLGYTATADRAQPIVVDPEEIAEARWFTRGDIATMIAGEFIEPMSGVAMNLPMRSSIAFYLIERWLGGFAR
jgi:NAD+ diphosphatase